jgi:hypothetical protein
MIPFCIHATSHGKKMKHRWTILLLISLTTGCTSSSVEPVEKDKALNEAVAAHNATAKPENKVTCRRVRELGSNFARRVCKTNQEIEQDLKNTQEMMDQIRNTTKTNTN